MTAAGRSKLNVLVADDDPVIRKSYGTQLRAAGWTVTIAVDGYMALQETAAQKFDVVLLDLRMPFRNGVDVLRSLRARATPADTAVFVLAQAGDADLIDRALREGADGVLDKTRATAHDVVADIENFFRSGGRAAAGGCAPAPASDNVPASVEEIARRFRRTTGSPRPEGARPTTGSTTNPAEAAARATAARIQKRETAEKDRGAPPPTRRPTADDGRPVAAAPPGASERESAAPPPLTGPSFSVVLNRFVGEAARLADAVGIPDDYVCPVCRQQLALRLWLDAPAGEGVRGHFYCPRCRPA